MNIPLQHVDPKSWSEVAREWMGMVQQATGVPIGWWVVIVAGALFSLKIISVWRRGS